MLVSERRAEAIKLKEAGATYADIGKKFGVSRQRAWNIINGNQKWVNPHPGGTMARKERERRYISQYMKDTYPDMNWQLNVELGPIPAEYVQRYGVAKAAALFRPTRPRVDAVRWEPGKYLLIEAKLRDIKSGIGDLLYYKSSIPETPDLPFYDEQPVACRLVIPWMLEWLQPIATANGIEIVVQYYDFVDEYVRDRQHYFTAEYRAHRAERQKLIDILIPE